MPVSASVQLIFTLLVTGLLGCGLSGCAPAISRADPALINELPQLQRVHDAQHTLAYVEAGTPGQPLVLMIHGTPGSWQAFAKFLGHPKLHARTHMLAIDRLGFGQSTASGVQPDFAVHSRAIGALLQAYPSEHPVTVVGHSLGGSLALQVALDHPRRVGAVLSISAAIDPALSAPRWYHRLADLPGVKQTIPRGLHLANEEMLQLQTVLTDMAPRLGDLRARVGIIQGDLDPLVAAHHARFALANMANADVMVHRFPQRGHFIIWQHSDFVVDEILRLSRPSTSPIAPRAQAATRH